jgi:hypothetical protein
LRSAPRWPSGGRGLPPTRDPASGAGVCTLSGTTVTYTAAGTCIIDASQPDNGTYAAAPPAPRKITVVYRYTAGQSG